MNTCTASGFAPVNKKTSATKKKTSGFTLVEIMIAVILLGIISAVVYANVINAPAQTRLNAKASNATSAQMAVTSFVGAGGSIVVTGSAAPSYAAGVLTLPTTAVPWNGDANAVALINLLNTGITAGGFTFQCNPAIATPASYKVTAVTATSATGGGVTIQSDGSSTTLP